ncbi:hypothetical protein G9A89_009703 [Geosiphon pyriformis]|nr:hypothetical protein G9A89_009703 [Geosiphon pyriformis]
MKKPTLQHLFKTVTEPKETGTNHLRFVKSLFQHYHAHLGLTNNSWPTESAFNCYVNKRIVYHLEAKEIQNLPLTTFSVVRIHFVFYCIGNYSYLSQQLEEHFETHNKNNLDFIELNPLLSCLICFPIEDQFSKQFQDFWNWFLNKHSAETYTAYTTYYFDQAYFEDNFKERNNSINQLLYSTTFEQQPPNSEYLNHQIHIWIAAHQATETLFETEEESYQTASVFDLLSSKSDSSTQTKEETIPHYHYLELDDFKRAAIANQYDKKYKWTPINAGKENTSFTIWFETKFRTPILISKWCIELERRTQDPREVVTEYIKAIRKLIKHNPTMDMAIELVQKIKDNQRMHLRFTLPVFAPASVIAPAPQMAAASFVAQTQDPNEQLIDRLTANLVWLLEPLAQAGKSASQPEENLFYAFNLTDDDHNMNELAINTFEPKRKKKKAKIDFVINSKKVSTLTADNNELPKTKVFKNSPKLELPEIVQKSGPYSVVKDLMETSVHIIFGQLITHPQFRKNLYKSLIPKKKTPKTNKHPCQAELANNNNVTPLICKAKVAGYFIDLILDSGLSVSVIAKHFLEAIGRKINKPSTRPMTNVHGNKKKSLSIVKAVPV